MQGGTGRGAGQARSIEGEAADEGATCSHEAEGAVMSMRIRFVAAVTRRQAAAECPWAARIVMVDGGWMCFESLTDYATWMAQT